jgi:hypothetical protein
MKFALKLLLLLVPLLLTSCLSSAVRWPGWARDLSSRLECGMHVEQVRELTTKEVRPVVAGGHPWLGDYSVDGGRSDLALMLDKKEGLESIALFQVDGWRIKSTRVSPRRNLCSGELTFLLRIRWSYALLGAEVYLDGQEIDPEAWVRPELLEVSGGLHELRFLKEGHEPVIRTFNLELGDRGEQLVDLPD